MGFARFKIPDTECYQFFHCPVSRPAPRNLRQEREVVMKRTSTDGTKPGFAESEAILRAHDGDAAAFEYLYREHSRRVYGICLRILKNTSEAEDVTQQIFLRVFRGIGKLRGDSCFSTWLHGVTVNEVLMHLSRKVDGNHHRRQESCGKA